MAQTQLPHFEHHRREVQLTRKRFRLTMLVLVMALTVTVGAQYVASHAANTPEIQSEYAGKCAEDELNTSGTVTHAAVLWDCNGSAGQQISYSGTHLTRAGLCLVPLNNGTASGTKLNFVTCGTAASQNWTRSGNAFVNAPDGLCLDDTSRITTNGNPLELWTCNGGNNQIWTVGTYVSSSTPTPPTPAPSTPTPVVQTPTPKPPSTRTPAPSAHASATPALGGGAVAGGSTALSAPGGFGATVSASNAVVTLTWTAPASAVGIKSYSIDKSLDQSAWDSVSGTVAGTTYVDKSAVFGVHYFYRISATDNSGKVSPYAYADIETPDFAGNSGADSSNTYTSDDKVASVLLPSGAVDATADCSVLADANIKPTTSKHVVVGPYQLTCKDNGGAVITSYNQALTWTINVSGKLKGLTSPQAYTVDQTGLVTAISNAKYSAAAGTMSFTTTTTDDVLVLAVAAPGIPWDFIVAVLIVLVIIGGVMVLILRKQQKSSYDDYLRQKYYNL